MSVGVLVVDDHVAFRRAAHAVIEATAGFKPVGDAASGPDALLSADRVRPDLVLMDIHLPGMDGFEAARRLTEAHPESVVVLISLEDIHDVAAALMSCGAVAFMRKQDLRPAILRGLWTAHRSLPPSGT